MDRSTMVRWADEPSGHTRHQSPHAPNSKLQTDDVGRMLADLLQVEPVFVYASS